MWRTALASTAVLLAATLALAQPVESRRWGIEIDAPSECASQFETELLLKTRHVLVDAAATRRLRVHLNVSRDIRGTLDVADIDGAPPTHRELTGADCTEVVRGLALIAALTIDPPTSAPSAAAPDGGDGRAAEAPSAAPPEPKPESAGQRPGVAASVDAEASALAGPVFSFGPSAALYLRREGVFAPALRIRGAIAIPTDATSTSGSARLGWTFGTIEACPLRFGGTGPDPAVAVRPCVGADVGVLTSRGEGPLLATTQSNERFWAAGRAEARLSWRFVGRLALDLASGLEVPLTREKLVLFSPSGVPAPVYRPPPAAFCAGAGVGMHF